MTKDNFLYRPMKNGKPYLMSLAPVLNDAYVMVSIVDSDGNKKKEGKKKLSSDGKFEIPQSWINRLKAGTYYILCTVNVFPFVYPQFRLEIEKN